MRFQTDRDTLADAVGWAARALPARPAAPLLAGMRLAVRNDRYSSLDLSTFDYEVSAKAAVPVTVDEEGSVLVLGPSPRRDHQGPCRRAPWKSKRTGRGSKSNAAAPGSH